MCRAPSRPARGTRSNRERRLRSRCAASMTHQRLALGHPPHAPAASEDTALTNSGTRSPPPLQQHVEIRGRRGTSAAPGSPAARAAATAWPCFPVSSRTSGTAPRTWMPAPRRPWQRGVLERNRSPIVSVRARPPAAPTISSTDRYRVPDGRVADQVRSFGLHRCAECGLVGEHGDGRHPARSARTPGWRISPRLATSTLRTSGLPPAPSRT